MILKSDFIEKANRLGEEKQAFIFLVDFLGSHPVVYSPEEAEKIGLKSCFNRNDEPDRQKYLKKIEFEKYPVAFEEYKIAFQKVMHHIRRGDSFLLNLTFQTKLITSLNLQEIYKYSRAKYKLLMPGRFVVFSPEPFITIRNNVISSYPMKGTIDASVTDAENLLLDDFKEKAEHNTIVDLIRNDLSLVAKKVKVDKFRYVEEIEVHDKILLQTSSAISGHLEKNWQKRIGNILAKMLPAGSISGAPKMKTVEIIEAVEGYERGYFTGVMGYFDGENLQSAVMIRFIEKIGDQLFFKSGGGITHFSNARSEYEEMIQKVYVPIV